MAKKKTTKNKTPKGSSNAAADPKFPYVNNTNSLRQFLREVPNKPKPPKLTYSVLESWGFTSTNDRPIVATLKKLGFLDAAGHPTDKYESFMHPGTGPQVMGAAVRDIYAPLFVSSHEPDKEDAEDLKRLFNIHSGGSEQTLRFQIQTFKALCEFSDFSSGPAPLATTAQTGNEPQQTGPVTSGNTSHLPNVHIDLHIHLPENKTSRDYEAIIQDIARYIYRTDLNDNE